MSKRHGRGHRIGQPYWMDGKGKTSADYDTSEPPISRRQERLNRRALGTNPRAVGTNPRTKFGYEKIQAMNERRKARGMAPLGA